MQSSSARLFCPFLVFRSSIALMSKWFAKCSHLGNYHLYAHSELEMLILEHGWINLLWYISCDLLLICCDKLFICLSTNLTSDPPGILILGHLCRLIHCRKYVCLCVCAMCRYLDYPRIYTAPKWTKTYIAHWNSSLEFCFWARVHACECQWLRTQTLSTMKTLYSLCCWH